MKREIYIHKPNVIGFCPLLAERLGLNASVVFSIIKKVIYNKSHHKSNFDDTGRVTADITWVEIPFISKKKIINSLSKLQDDDLLTIDSIEPIQFVCRLNWKTPTDQITDKSDPEKKDKSAKMSVGYLYFAKDTALPDFIKIGFSRTPVFREKTLQAQKPTIEFISTHRGDYTLENRMHFAFRDKRHRGEWFKVSYEECIEKLNEITETKEII